MSQQIQISGGAKVRDLQDVIIGTSGVLSSLAFNVANGVPKLDVNGKILVSQLPNSVMEYKGTWNISTNTPTLVNGTGNQGDVYLVEGAAVGGTSFNFGAGSILFFNGDQAIYSGSIWQRASGATGTVTSVAITESGDSLNITGSPITTSGTINIGFNGTNLQYVNGAGNLTTFPILTGYVPYTGATQDVDLGAFKLNAQSLHIKGTGGLGHLGLKHQSASATASANEVSLFADSLGDLSWLNGNLYLSKFITSGNTAARSYTFPNANGTVALTSDLTGYLTAVTATSPLSSSGGTTPNITIAQATTSANGYLSSTDWNTFNGKQNAITLTTTGSSGISTLVGATLNIPDYGSALTGYVTLATTQTITGAKTFSAYTTFTSTVDITSGLTFSNSGFTLVLQPPTLSVNRTVTLPNATGTLALTTDIPSITGLVPYTGATNNVGLGIYSITASTGSFTSYILNDGSILMKNVGKTSTSSGYNTFYSLASGFGFGFADFAGNDSIFTFSATGDYTYTFPAASGTIALVGGSGVGTVTSVAALTIGTTGTDLSSTVANSTTTPVITLNVPTASATNRGALSSADWTTFNNKQNALTNPVLASGTWTSGYLPKINGTYTIGNSIVQETASGINVAFSNSGASNVFEFQNTSNTSSSNARLKIATGGTSGGNAILQFTDNTNNWYINPDSAASYSLKIGTSISDNKLVLTTSGNLGLGVTPSAWSGFTAMQVQTLGIWSAANDNYANFSSNSYFDGSNNRYITTQAATLYQQYRGNHYWFQAPSGTAGAAITFTQAMTLTAAGNLGVGTISPGAKLTVQSTGATGILLEQDGSNASVSSRLVARYNAGTGTIRYDTGGWRINTGATLDATSGTERALFSQDGYFRMLSGTGGVQFQGTTGVANALNYYEEGTWTPSILGATGESTYPSNRLGWYTRVGRLVTITWFVSITKNNMTGTLRMSGFPFTLLSGGAFYPQGTVLLDSLAVATNNITLQGANNSTSGDFIGGNGSTSTHTGLPVSVLGSGTMECRGTLTYFTA